MHVGPKDAPLPVLVFEKDLLTIGTDPRTKGFATNIKHFERRYGDLVEARAGLLYEYFQLQFELFRLGVQRTSIQSAITNHNNGVAQKKADGNPNPGQIIDWPAQQLTPLPAVEANLPPNGIGKKQK